MGPLDISLFGRHCKEIQMLVPTLKYMRQGLMASLIIA